MGHVYAGTYESHPVAIKKHKMDGSMMDHKALVEFEIEVRSGDAPLDVRACVRSGSCFRASVPYIGDACTYP